MTTNTNSEIKIIHIKITQEDIKMCDEIINALTNNNLNETNIKKFGKWYSEFIKLNIEKIANLDAETINAICEKIDKLANQSDIYTKLQKGIVKIIQNEKPKFRTAGGSRKINKSVRKNRSRKYKQTGGLLPIAAILVLGVAGIIAIGFCSTTMLDELKIKATKLNVYLGAFVCIPYHAYNASLWFAKKMKSFYDNRQNIIVNPTSEKEDINLKDIELKEEEKEEEDRKLKLIEKFGEEGDKNLGDENFGGSKLRKQIKNKSKKLKRYKKSRLA